MRCERGEHARTRCIAQKEAVVIGEGDYVLYSRELSASGRKFVTDDVSVKNGTFVGRYTTWVEGVRVSFGPDIRSIMFAAVWMVTCDI